MEISFDEAKRQRTLDERGLDFSDAPAILAGLQYTFVDDRLDYAEERFVTIGLLNLRLVALVWTPTENGVRVISLRKCNDREQRAYSRRLG